MSFPNTAAASFDAYARDYDAALAQGLSATGEDKDYFAQGRINWLAQCLASFPMRIRKVLDYGCGTGTAIPFLHAHLSPGLVVGVDLSDESLQEASRRCREHRTEFRSLRTAPLLNEAQLAFCNGVFHHIPPAERPGALAYIRDALVPGGWFAFWENNPWNPGTRYVMSRVPFDRDAIPLSASQARALLRSAGFEVLRTDYLFIFPRVLRWLRGLEPFLTALPLGGQYQVLCQKPIAEHARRGEGGSCQGEKRRLPTPQNARDRSRTAPGRRVAKTTPAAP